MLETAKLAARSAALPLNRQTDRQRETDRWALFPSHLGRSDGQHLFEAFLNGRLNYLGGGGGGGFMHMALTSKRETGFGAPRLLRSFNVAK